MKNLVNKTAASLGMAATIVGIGGFGIAGASSASAATARVPQAAVCDYITEHYGMKDVNVRTIQTQINRFYASKGWKTRIAVDGMFGSGTRNAVITTQRALGLHVDGVVGPSTYKALNVVTGACA